MFFKKISILLFLILLTSQVSANVPKSTGKYKNWESFSAETDKGKVCFAQSIPNKRAPSSIKRSDSRLFVTFRPGDKIKDEISITSGHAYKASTVVAKSGKNDFTFFSQDTFAWLLDTKEEQSFIKLMKRATNLIITARTIKGAETTDHYSMMGFTKAYNTAKKACS
jgi:hypothetical protein